MGHTVTLFVDCMPKILPETNLLFQWCLGYFSRIFPLDACVVWEWRWLGSALIIKVRPQRSYISHKVVGKDNMVKSFENTKSVTLTKAEKRQRAGLYTHTHALGFHFKATRLAINIFHIVNKSDQNQQRISASVSQLPVTPPPPTFFQASSTFASCEDINL